MLALLFAAVAPGASYAFAGESPQRFMEICTSHGVETIQLDGATGTDGDTSPGSHLSACDHCIAHCQLLAPPPPARIVVAQVTGRDFHPPLFYSAPRPLHAWTAAAPRGPPSIHR